MVEYVCRITSGDEPNLTDSPILAATKELKFTILEHVTRCYMCQSFMPTKSKCDHFGVLVKPNGFCSFGKRVSE